MFKKCLPVVLALVLVGCGGTPPNTSQSTDASANTTVESAVSTESIGDYTFSVPSTWTKEGDSFYIGDVGDVPYMYVVQDEFTIADLLEYTDDFIDGVLQNFDESKLSSGLAPVSYDYADGYAFSFTGKIKGYDTNNVFTFFENPSGGLVSLCLMEEGFDYLPQYYDVLNTVKTDAPILEEQPVEEEQSSDTPASDEVPAEEPAEKPAEEKPEEPEEKTEEESSSVSTGERNALSKAKDYLSFSPFSYSGLIKQLEFEGFSHDEAVYGADHCGADWEAQAVEKAKSYLDFSAFSYSGLIEQLEFEGYTHEEATHGADKCEADWNEQAVKKAKEYLKFSSFSRDGLKEQLEFEGFTSEQAEYGVSQSYD
jgi:hypothetical protein